MDPHRRAGLRSLAYHRAVAERLRSEPEILDRALARLAVYEARGLVGAACVHRWRGLLGGPRDALLAVLVAGTEGARAFRQATPFAGVLDPRERWRLFREVAPSA